MQVLNGSQILSDSTLFSPAGNNFEATQNGLPKSNNDLSPTNKSSVALNTISNSENVFNDPNSSLHLSSMLQSISFANDNNQLPALNTTTASNFSESFALTMKSLPKDITSRECHAIFALAENVVSLELIHPDSESVEGSEDKKLNEPKITDGTVRLEVKFSSLQPALKYAFILNKKSDIFGPNFPFSSTVQLIDLSNGNLIDYVKLFNQQTMSLPSASIATNAFGPSFSKKSRFSFSDSFPNDASSILNQSVNNRTQSTGNILQKNSSNAAGSNIIPNANNTGMLTQPPQPQGFQDVSSTTSTNSQSRDVGKSILLMENDEINDTIWGSNGISFGGNVANEIIPNAQQPSTPIFEWGPTSSSRKQSNAFLFHQPVNNLNSSQTQSKQQSVTPSLPNGSSTQLSAITNESFLPQSSNNAPLSPFALVPPSVNASNQGQVHSQLNSQAPTSSSILLQNSSYEQQHSNLINQQPSYHNLDTLHQESKSQNTTPQKLQSSMRPSRTTTTAIKPTQKSTSSSALSFGNLPGSNTISQADLSLLAKVPPPANPADQNPPCNTLYVGNLPSDATEQELRQLFSAQPGFRRLSFRNKNTNGNGHGPICFVEFDDVSFATRALAELYGCQLPSSNVSNKGGIRLSFSKNPLGVRGPNSRRNNSGTSINTLKSNSTYNYVTGYSK